MPGDCENGARVASEGVRARAGAEIYQPDRRMLGSAGDEEV